MTKLDVKVDMSESLLVANPETVFISLVKVWPVVTKLEVIVAISLSFPSVSPETVTISAAKVEPVDAKLLVRVDTFDVNVSPVEAKLLVKVDISPSFEVICVCRLCPVVTRFAASAKIPV